MDFANQAFIQKTFLNCLLQILYALHGTVGCSSVLFQVTTLTIGLSTIRMEMLHISVTK